MEWAVERRRGKIFFDYNQNSRGKSLAVPYSPRRHPAATVSDADPLGRAGDDLSDRFHPAHRRPTGSSAKAIRGPAFSTPSRTSAPSSARAARAVSPRLRRDPQDRGRLRYRAQPGWIPPMLATLTDQAPAGAGWVYEPKLDGVRVLVYVDRRRGAAVSRATGSRWRAAIPSWCEALANAVRGDAVLDGEIVAPDPETGLSSFARLQQRMHLRDADARGADRRGRSSSISSTASSTRGSTSPACRCSTARRCCATWCGSTTRSASRRTAPPASAAMYREACAQGRGGDHRQARGRALRQRPLHRLAQDQMRAAAGVRHRRLHRPPGRARAPRRAAGGLLRRRQAALRGEGRHRLRPLHAGAARTQAGAAPPPHVAVRVRAGAGGGRAVGHAEAGGADRVSASTAP